MNLQFKSFGQGPPVVILHGLFGTLDNWQTIAKQLSESFTVFILDIRNHGRSPHTPTHTYPELAEDVVQFMESQWVYKAHIVGHSMGGKIAMQMALEYPDRVDKLVVVDIAPKKYAGGHEAIFQALLEAPHIGQPSEASLRNEIAEYLQNRIPDIGTRLFLLKNLTRNTQGAYEWKMNLPVLWENYRHLMDELPAKGTFEGETLFIKGELSDYILDTDWPAIQAIFPNAQQQVIAGAAHWVHADKPDDMLDALTRFL